MNFLAHLLLSGNDDDLMVGNFIADAVRSSQWDRFEPQVLQGIKLHHKIDFFTDNHPIVEQTKLRLRPKQGKYSPVVADILYDHFLARNFHNYHHIPLPEFSESCYSLFQRRWQELPPAVKHMLPYMQSGNWLVNYGNRKGLQRVFEGMSRRATFRNAMNEAVDDLFNEYQLYEKEFESFFPLLREYVDKEINNMPWP